MKSEVPPPWLHLCCCWSCPFYLGALSGRWPQCPGIVHIDLSSECTFLGLYSPVSQCSTALLLHSSVSHSPSPRLPHEGKSNSHVISQHGLTTQSTNDLIYNHKEEKKYTRLYCSILKEKPKKYPAFLRHCSFPYGVKKTPMLLEYKHCMFYTKGRGGTTSFFLWEVLRRPGRWFNLNIKISWGFLHSLKNVIFWPITTILTILSTVTVFCRNICFCCNLEKKFMIYSSHFCN